MSFFETFGPLLRFSFVSFCDGSFLFISLVGFLYWRLLTESLLWVSCFSVYFIFSVQKNWLRVFLVPFFCESVLWVSCFVVSLFSYFPLFWFKKIGLFSFICLSSVSLFYGSLVL